MGVDYNAVAGYGKELTEKNLNEKGLKLLEEQADGDLTEMAEYLKIRYNTIGCMYSGTSVPCLIFDDPLSDLEGYEKFKQDLIKLDIFKDPSPDWICELYIW